MNKTAGELNQKLKGSPAWELLSDFGKRIYFPKGIISQSAEAKKAAKTANGTIGMAFHHKKPIMLSALRRLLPQLEAEEVVTYTPTEGILKLRELWQAELLKKNPSLAAAAPESITLPVVVPGISAGISGIGELFFDSGDTLIVSDPCWDNYTLIFEERRGAKLKGVHFLEPESGADGALNIENIKKAVRDEAKKGAVRILLNFPNNPAGYSPVKSEVDALCAILFEAAEGGANVLVICDDAYFGLFYEENIFKESVFTRFCSLHKRILAVKADGPTKEDYVWGLRTAFLTFGGLSLNGVTGAALVEKLKGVIRSSVSCSSTISQNLILQLYNCEESKREKEDFFGVLKRKYEAVKNFVRANKSKNLQPLPFNSGYFMSFYYTGDADALRQKLLEREGIGVISISGRYIRIAFSSLGEADIAPVIQKIYAYADE